MACDPDGTARLFHFRTALFDAINNGTKGVHKSPDVTGGCMRACTRLPLYFTALPRHGPFVCSLLHGAKMEQELQ